MTEPTKPGSSDFGYVFEIAWEVVNKGIISMIDVQDSF